MDTKETPTARRPSENWLCKGSSRRPRRRLLRCPPPRRLPRLSQRPRRGCPGSRRTRTFPLTTPASPTTAPEVAQTIAPTTPGTPEVAQTPPPAPPAAPAPTAEEQALEDLKATSRLQEIQRQQDQYDSQQKTSKPSLSRTQISTRPGNFICRRYRSIRITPRPRPASIAS